MSFDACTLPSLQDTSNPETPSEKSPFLPKSSDNRKRIPWLHILGECLYWPLRIVSCRPSRALILALIVFAVPYVEEKRNLSPFRIDSILDIPSHLGNVLYTVPKNAVLMPWNLVQGKFTEAKDNVLGILGLRTTIYDQLRNHRAVNQAEWFALNGVWVFFSLVGISTLTYLYDRRIWGTRPYKRPRFKPLHHLGMRYRGWIRRTHGDPISHGLNGVADTLGFAFTYVFFFANTARYFQEATGPLNWVDKIGGVVVSIADIWLNWAVALKELVYHLLHFLGPGKEQLAGRFADSEVIESIAHYLDDFPLDRLDTVYATSLYYALLAWLLARFSALVRERWWRITVRTWNGITGWFRHLFGWGEKAES